MLFRIVVDDDNRAVLGRKTDVDQWAKEKGVLEPQRRYTRLEKGDWE